MWLTQYLTYINKVEWAPDVRITKSACRILQRQGSWRNSWRSLGFYACGHSSTYRQVPSKYLAPVSMGTSAKNGGAARMKVKAIADIVEHPS